MKQHRSNCSLARIHRQAARVLLQPADAPQVRQPVLVLWPAMPAGSGRSEAGNTLFPQLALGDKPCYGLQAHTSVRQACSPWLLQLCRHAGL